MTTLHHVPSLDGTSRPPQAVLVPASLDEALRMLAEPGAEVLGGGVGHILRRHDRRPADATALVAVAGLPGLDAVTWSADQVVIGAGVRLSTVEHDARLAAVWPVVTEAAGSVATARIRRMVTLGGNLAAADDSHDPPVALAAAGAELTVRGADAVRTLHVTDLAGPDGLRPGELIQDIRLPIPPTWLPVPGDPTAAPGPVGQASPAAVSGPDVRRGAVGSAYEKFLVRGVWEYACVNAAAVVRLDGGGALRGLALAVGSVAGGPVLVEVADLVGGAMNAAVTAEAARRASAATRPYSDVRGSAAYKSRMIAEFARRALVRAARRAAEGTDR